jgi:hypothetical protein
MALIPSEVREVKAALGTSFGRHGIAEGAAAGAAAGPGAILDAAVQLGAQALYVVADAVGASLAADSALLMERRSELPVLAIDAVLGAARPGPSGGGRHGIAAARAQLASLDRDEAAAAVDVARAGMLFAQEVGAAYVVVSLGTARALGRLWRRLRGRYLRGVLHYDESSAEALMAARAGVSSQHVDAAMRSLDRVVEEASRRGVSVLVRNPRQPVDLPTALELSALRAELRGAPLAPLLDLPAAHLTSMLHCCPLRETVVAFGDGPLSSLADACGPLYGLIPGQGEVDVAAVARALPKDARRAFVPSPGLSIDEVARGYAAIASL